MPLHVPVNGRFGRPISRLDDPEKVRKDLESQRRITRLKQVRDKSNQVARKIREDVTAERKRQINNLQQAQESQLNAWREHALAQKHNDCRSAIFQVGAAHRAAREETERAELLKQQKIEKIKKARQLAMKRSARAVVELRAVPSTTLNAEGRASAGTQTPMSPFAEDFPRLEAGYAKPSTKPGRKCGQARQTKQTKPARRRSNGLSPEPEGSSSEEDRSLLPCTSPSSLQRNPAVILDVDINDTDPEEQDLHIEDRFTQTNRKFSHVVCPSPESSPERSEASRPKRFTQISDLVKKNMAAASRKPLETIQEDVPRTSAPPSPTKSLPRSPRKAAEPPQPAAKSPAASPKKASSSTRQAPVTKRNGVKTNPPPAKVIDAGIRKPTVLPKSKTPAPSKTSVASKTSAPSKPEAPPQQPAEQQMPPQPQEPVMCLPNPNFPMQPQYQLAQPYLAYPQAYVVPYAMPYGMQPAYPPPQGVPPQGVPPQGVPPQGVPPQALPPPQMYATAPMVPASMPLRAEPKSVTTTTSGVSTATFVASRDAPSNPSGRVQFYDHSNKYHRTYEAPTQSVQSNERDATQPNAMEQARVETHLRDLREQELDKLRKISADRGRKALEREQVRRDCAELTDKLDALTQQQPQLLPTDADIIPSHRFADTLARKEQKMNEQLEDMLYRPSIITCPEVRTNASQPGTARGKPQDKTGAINLGMPQAQRQLKNVRSTESSCSLLLDYVDDQSKQLKSDLKAEESNSEKCKRLRNLLERTEKIRRQLLRELEEGEAAASKGEQEQLINSIRQERADILSQRTRTLDERESELQQKEAILEQRLRKFYRETNEKKASNGQAAGKSGIKPMEIIIKVRSDGSVAQCLPKTLPNGQLMEPVVMEKEVASGSTPREVENPSKTDSQKPPSTSKQRQDSIDSNSTSYRSLPPVSYTSYRPGETGAAQPQPPPLHPQIAYYVQQLLGMSRQTIDDLGVSSSDVATPSNSLVNAPHNVPPCNPADVLLLDERQLQRVESFINENRSLVQDLEETLRLRQQMLDKENRTTVDAWGERLSQNAEECGSSVKEQTKKQSKRTPRAERPPEKPKTSQGKPSPRETRRTPPASARDAQKRAQPTGSSNEKRAQPTANSTKLSTQSAQSSRVTRPQESAESSAAERRRYENCNQRIAELTNMIIKVREEKQRLVEVTLTSASEGERHSTEYYELPNGQMQQQLPPGRHTRSRTVSDRSDTLTPSVSEALPLQKNKPNATSRDSGIADSRPITALDQVACVEMEPLSLPSSTQSAINRQRTKAPPPTIRRYSPQLDAEDAAHELSTIAEVETPGQSHIVPAEPVPRPFPTFEQYAREMNLNLSDFDANQSRRMEGDFNELVRMIQQRNVAADYREFASISAYLRNAAEAELSLDRDTLMPGDMMRQLRMPDVSLRRFPDRREYLRQILANEPSDQRQLIDSVSLDQESSESMDVEQELRQRKILKTSFRRGNVTEQTEVRLDVASSTRRESVGRALHDHPNESGIDPISGSGGSSDTEHEVSHCWHAAIHQRRRRQMENDGMASSTTDVSPERVPRKSRTRGGSQMQDASKLGKEMNLRDFLAHELLKHCKPADSSQDTSDDSLRQHFMNSVRNHLSPGSKSQTPAIGNSHATGVTNDRQKTSTPMGSYSMQDKSRSVQSTGSQLFSGESRISLVHYPDGTPPIPFEHQQRSKQSTTNQTRQHSGKKGTSRRSPQK
ncbi:hypothetical protein KR018_004324 [Drosophila ironensis]|nr:hypothetical protein KR018_004324 [Drosophila ironensis]